MRWKLMNSSALVVASTLVTVASAHATDYTVAAGATDTTQKTLNGTDTLTVNGTGTLSTTTDPAVRSNNAVTGVVITNSGTIQSTATGGRAIRFQTGGTGAAATSRTFTITNNPGGLIQSQNDAINLQPAITAGTIVINNAGTIQSTGVNGNNGQAIDFNNIVGLGASVTINNLAGGVLQAADSDGIRPGNATQVNNAGSIIGNNFQTNTGADGVDFQTNTSGAVHNLAGGTISGGRHGINLSYDPALNTTASSVTVINDAGGTIIGRNGSGVGVDVSAVVTNYGTISGRIDAITGIANGDGDGVDIDYTGTITNFGLIEGTGAKGVGSDGKVNTAQGVAIGGGLIDNRVGATIRGQADGILADDSSEGPAFSAVTVINAGTITGTDRYGIFINSTLNNTITNSGTISGSAAAVLLGSGSDTLNLITGSVINGLVDGGAGNDTINLSGTGTFAGAVNFEQLFVSGGRWTLTGAQSYANGITINADATLVASTAIAGSIRDNGLLVFNRTDDNTFSDTISGSGAVTKLAANTLTLTGQNTYTGGTTISAGTLRIGAGGTTGSIVGNVVDDGVLAFNRSDAVTFAGVISGTGSLSKLAANTLTLTGQNSYTGGTTINAGTLQIGAGGTTGSLVGNVVDNGVLAFNRSDAVTFAGAISGTGSLAKPGAGSLTLSGQNTYSAGTTISAGTLIGSATSFGTGGLLDNATLLLDQPTNATFSNTIAGTGILQKQGAGRLELTGTSTLSGATQVIAGMLAINGSLGSSTVTVLNGASLGGNGTIGGLVVANGATIAPGNSIGTLNVNGNIAVQSGATYQVEINASGQSDLVAASGRAALLGGTVSVLAASGAYAPSTRYTILAAAGGVSGAFDGATSSLAFLSPSLSYDANDAYLTLTRTATFQSVALSRNQQSVAAGLDRIPTNSPLFATLVSQSTDSARGSFTALSGEGATGAQIAAQRSNHLFSSAIGDQVERWRNGNDAGGLAVVSTGEPEGVLSYADRQPRKNTPVIVAPTASPQPLWRVWAAGLVDDTHLSGNAAVGSAEIGTRSYGGAFGIDYRVDTRFLFGVAVAGSDTRFAVNDRAETGTTDGFHVAGYGAWRDSFGYVSGTIAYATFNNHLNRSIVGIGATENATGSFRSDEWRGRLEVGHDLALGSARLTPFAAIELATLRSNAFNESSAAAPAQLGLSYFGRNTPSAPLFLGARLEDRYAFDNGMAVRPSLSLAWVHEFAPDHRLGASFIAYPDASFVVSGARSAADSLQIKGGFDLALTASASFFTAADAEISGRSHSFGGRGGLRIVW